jgi:fatty acyl-CoA reductase
MKPALNVQAALTGKRVLITGSTGFLAKVVLEKLIRSVPDIGRIVLLIRGGRNGADARARFECDIATSSVFDRLRAERPDYLTAFFAEKIECVTGEVTAPGFGLPIAAFNALARRIDLVINAAASVNFREALDEALRHQYPQRPEHQRAGARRQRAADPGVHLLRQRLQPWADA